MTREAEFTLERIERLLAAILAEMRGEDAPGLTCPTCGNRDETMIRDTSVMGAGRRWTCAASGCGTSWRDA